MVGIRAGSEWFGRAWTLRSSDFVSLIFITWGSSTRFWIGFAIENKDEKLAVQYDFMSHCRSRICYQKLKCMPLRFQVASSKNKRTQTSGWVLNYVAFHSIRVRFRVARRKIGFEVHTISGRVWSEKASLYDLQSYSEICSIFCVEHGFQETHIAFSKDNARFHIVQLSPEMPNSPYRWFEIIMHDF
jgi:hypothetical protein